MSGPLRVDPTSTTGTGGGRLAIVAHTVVHPPEAGPGAIDDPAEDAVEVRPWWQNPVNLIVIALALLVLAGALGYVVGNNRATPDPDDADIGFLHDMRTHHEQAVQMGQIYLADDGIDPQIAVVARSIVVGQSIEVGRMIQLLRDFGAPEASDSDVSMGWMGPPIATDQMPGLATRAQLEALAGASGADADRQFVQLMVAHHRGGIHMATEAARLAADHEVIAMATSMASGQQEEINELEGLAPG